MFIISKARWGLLSHQFLFFLTAIMFFIGVENIEAQLIPGSADSSNALEEVSVPEWPEDSLGRRTPLGTVRGFIAAAADKNFGRAARYLNLDSEFQNESGSELAYNLKRLLDQGGKILPYSWISDEFVGKEDDELEEGLDRVGSISINDESYDIFVEVVSGPNNAPLWLFSAETVKLISEIEAADSASLVERFLPEFLQKTKWGRVSIGQWLVMVVLVILSYLISWAITAVTLFIIPKFWKKAETQPTAGIIKAFALPIKLYLAVWLFVYSSEAAGISFIVRQKFLGITIIIGLVAFLMLLWRLSEFITSFSEKQLTNRKHFAGVSVVLFLRRAAKIAIVIFGIIVVLGIFGVDVTTGIAALGIGGIALALGAQKTVENFVGSVTLIADQPIRIGDFIKAGDTVGTVSEIGMRSTRVRTLDRTIVTIPNGEFSSLKIENYTHRDLFRAYAVFGLRYETSSDQIRFLLVELRKILYAHPKIDPDPARVRLIEFGSSSINIEIFAYVHAIDFNEFLEIREDLFLRMMHVVEESGTGFAFPSQTVYLARDKGLSKEKTEQAEQKVKTWREEGDLQIPGFSEERINALKSTITYPSEGSTKRDNTNL